MEPPRLLFDVTGLVAWYAFYATPTGIQRVIERILAAPAIAAHPRIVLVARVPGAETFFVVEGGLLRGLGDPARHAATVRRLRRFYVALLRRVSPVAALPELEGFQWKNVARAWLGLGRLLDGPDRHATDDAPPPVEPVRFAVGDVFVNLGDFWWYARQSQVLARLKARHGLRIVQMIHDLFPLVATGREPTGFRAKFIAQLAALEPLVDGWLVNSVFVGDQLADRLTEVGRAGAPVRVLPMGWTVPPASARRLGERDRTVLRDLGLAERGYFLQVGTLEPRKNHAAVLRAVQRLRAEHGAGLPLCVFAGVVGWNSEPLLRELEGSRYADGGIRWLRAVDDDRLATLYRGALFTTYPSVIEGWGLPVQESLSWGVPCIASAAGAIPEVGRDLARYVDPARDGTIVEAIADYTLDERRLAADRDRIAAWLDGAPGLPTWDDTARTVLDVAEAAS